MKIEIDTERQLLLINGAQIMFDALDLWTHPRTDFIYQFRRRDDVIEVMHWRTSDIQFPVGQDPMKP